MTTGGQQVIDLVCKTLIDPGDVIVAEAPTYPGRGARRSAPIRPTSCRSRWTATGMPIDELESTLDRLQAEGRRPKFIYTIPNFQNPGGVTMSLARRRRLVEVARERELLCWRTTPTACCATRASRCRRSTRWTPQRSAAAAPRTS